MSDYTSYLLAKQQMNERIANSERIQAAGRRRNRRHSLAVSLHHLADRIDH
jgi:hypothetical protein